LKRKNECENDIDSHAWPPCTIADDGDLDAWGCYSPGDLDVDGIGAGSSAIGTWSNSDTRLQGNMLRRGIIITAWAKRFGKRD
jgi:hypothetical protein